jgi:hypothetical protein
LGQQERKKKSFHLNQEPSTYRLGWLFIFSVITLLSELFITIKTVIYIGISGAGYLMILNGGNLLSRVIKKELSKKDVFKKENETFPQEELLLQNQYSINLPNQI